MRKHIKLIAVMLAIVCLATIFASCGKGSIVGKWVSGAYEWEFTEDGVFIQNWNGYPNGEFTYVYEDDIITYEDHLGQANTMKVKKATSDELIVVIDGVLEKEFKRAK